MNQCTKPEMPWLLAIMGNFLSNSAQRATGRASPANTAYDICAYPLWNMCFRTYADPSRKTSALNTQTKPNALVVRACQVLCTTSFKRLSMCTHVIDHFKMPCEYNFQCSCRHQVDGMDPSTGNKLDVKNKLSGCYRSESVTYEKRLPYGRWTERYGQASNERTNNQCQ